MKTAAADVYKEITTCVTETNIVNTNLKNCTLCLKSPPQCEDLTSAKGRYSQLRKFRRIGVKK